MKAEEKIAFDYVKINYPGSPEPFWVQKTEDLPKTNECRGIVIDPNCRWYNKIITFPNDCIIKTVINKNPGLHGLGSLDSPYIPAAESCMILDTIVPDSMDYEAHIAARRIRSQVGGNFIEYLKDRLKYNNEQLCTAMAAEQIDAVAMAIYNIERGQGMINGDQTGIGKGRTAAAIIRYGHLQGYQPIFLSEKPNLFSDIYRDLADIGSENLVPFIINGKESKTDVKDINGNVIYQALPPTEQNTVFKDQKVPLKYNYIMGTYSQFNSPERKNVKPDFLRAVSSENIIIMDEAHNASGSSNTGEFLQDVIKGCKGVVFLSATFAKRPDNMPIYAIRTAMSDANMTNEELVESIKKGGVALQEILSSQLVAEGQMIRRERSFDGVEVNYITLIEKEQEHRAISNNITSIIRDIISFQEKYIQPITEKADKVAAAEGKIIKERGGTSRAGVDNAPYFSKVFQVINQMLFSIKAESVAERAIERLKEGKKPVIAFASTMGSYLENMETDDGRPVMNGDKVNADFKSVLVRGLNGVMRYTERDHAGQPTYKLYTLDELDPEAKDEYLRIMAKIGDISTGITISPIDKIIKKIQDAGYTVAEVTGRKLEIQFDNGSDVTTGVVLSRKKLNVNDAFRQFNNNQVDILMINQSGSTGASAHAIKTDLVPIGEVKQRVMIILQAELNINTEVQKRGRINRTGQIYKPIYDYMTSAIPAEKRLMMMLQKKLKSLDANTTSNQKQSEKVLSVDDFLNKYGDKLCAEYLKEFPELNLKLGDPLGVEDENKEATKIPENFAHIVSGRVAVLSTQKQEEFYKEIIDRYNDYVEYLKQIGEYDLEIEIMNLDAETISARTIKEGIGGSSPFGRDSILEEVRVNILKKPFTKTELENLLRESLQGRDAFELQIELRENLKSHIENRLSQDIADIEKKWEHVTQNIFNEKQYKKLEKESDRDEYYKNRISEISVARTEDITNEKSKSENRFQFIDSILRSFHIGQLVKYPVEIPGLGQKGIPAVFLGYQIDFNRANPFAPSAVKLRFAISDSNKYIALPCSGDQGNKILAIKGISDFVGSDYIENWDKYTKESNANRGVRYIVTGNLLQAFSDYPGKLISFTTMDGSVRKGILMPEKWRSPVSSGSGVVIIPIERGLQYILNLHSGQGLATPNGIRIGKHQWKDEFVVIMPKSRAYKEIFTDAEILDLLVDKTDGFNMVSNLMRGEVAPADMPGLIKILQSKYKLSLEIPSSLHKPSVNIVPETQGTQKDILTIEAEQQFAKEKEKFEQREKPSAQTIPQTISDVEKAKARLKILLIKHKLQRSENK